MPDEKKRAMTEAFCCNYVEMGNAAEAAEKAGFEGESALSEAVKCLKNKKCRENIAQIREILSDSGNIVSGLKRLAFGKCTDAVYLVFADELPPRGFIEQLDLFNVSEIKRVKGGGVEVKFFDRLKALEKLFELENSFSDRDKAADLVRALSISAEEDDNCDNN